MNAPSRPDVAATGRISRRRALQLCASLGLLSTGGMLTACGGDAGDEGDASVTKDKIIIGTATDVLNFDPYQQTTNALLVLKLFNAWLMTYDEDLQAQPDVAKSYELSADRRTCMIILREDVVFQSGQTMTAADVVSSFERARDKAEGGNLTSPSAIISEVSSPEAGTVKLAFTEPIAKSLVEDLLVGQPVMEASGNNPTALASQPASAGPYQLVEWRPKQSIVLKAFDKWYGGTVPIQNVEIKIFTDAKAMSSALSSGSIDVAAFVPPRDAETVKEKFDYLDAYPGSATMLLRVSAKTAPFTDKPLRQALWHSVDRDRIVKEVLFGFGGPVALPFGPKSPAQTTAYDDRINYDLDKAKALLATVSTKSGKALVNGSDPVSVSVMQIIQSDLKKIGFDLQIEQVDAGAFQDRLVAGEFGVVLGQMGGGQLSIPRIAQNSLFRTANNPLWPDGNPPKAYVEAIDTLTTADDQATKEKAIKLLDETLVTEAWAIGAYAVPQLYMWNKSLGGVGRDHQNALLINEAKF